MTQEIKRCKSCGEHEGMHLQGCPLYGQSYDTEDMKGFYHNPSFDKKPQKTEKSDPFTDFWSY